VGEGPGMRDRDRAGHVNYAGRRDYIGGPTPNLEPAAGQAAAGG
jgi:hypothetical protein